jgi:predicted dehydrogenase
VRLALIGHTGHWQTYGPALKDHPELRLIGIAPGTEEDWLGGFDHAPGLTPETKRYDSPEALLRDAKPDIVQVCVRPDQLSPVISLCLERGVPVMADKPLAMDLAALDRLHELAQRVNVPLAPMHTYRGDPYVAAVREAVRAGKIGKPLVSYHQKSYRWGASRPAWFKSRRTFPGLAAYIGIHSFDWMFWVLGDAFTHVSAAERVARAEYPGTASHGGYLFRGPDGVATVSVDYLRPAKAPSHGDERLRIAGSSGVVEAFPVERRATLVTDAAAPAPLPPSSPRYWYSTFLDHVRGRGEPFITRDDAFRVTEIALRAQRAADTGREVALSSGA